MSERGMAAKLASITRKLTALDRRLSRLPRATPAAALAVVADVKLTAGTVVQTGWLECDGALYDSATYPALFAAIGTTYNTGGEAVGDFRVPDLAAALPDPSMLYVIKT